MPHRKTLDDVGLLLRDSLLYYDATPSNSSPFASTGGDGVHYSLLHINGKATESSPIIMTVPMAFESPNHVVGEDLLEFLCLGCRFGYSGIEGLAYEDRRDEAIAALERDQDPEDSWPEQADTLCRMRSRLGLRPWTDVRSRLHELHRLYFHELKVIEVD